MREAALKQQTSNVDSSNNWRIEAKLIRHKTIPLLTRFPSHLLFLCFEGEREVQQCVK